jgi:H+-transporting ATPase
VADVKLMTLVNKSVTLLVFGLGLIVTGDAVLTPFLQALAMLTNDFVTMARAADRARPSSCPNAWRVRNLILAAIPLGSFRLLYLLAILSLCRFTLRLSPQEMQTLTFVMLGFAGEGNVYALRERGRLWRSRPAPIMALASLTDVMLMGCFAAFGIAMATVAGVDHRRPGRHHAGIQRWRWTRSKWQRLPGYASINPPDGSRKCVKSNMLCHHKSDAVNDISQ